MCVDDHTVCIMSILKIFFAHFCCYCLCGLFILEWRECSFFVFYKRNVNLMVFLLEKKSEKFMIYFLCREKKNLDNLKKNDH